MPNNRSTNWLLLVAATLVLTLIAYFWIDDSPNIVPSISNEVALDTEQEGPAGSVSSDDRMSTDSSEIEDPSSVDDRALRPEPTVENFNPPKLYERYFERANNGELDAKYVLLKVLRHCQNVGKDGFLENIKSSSILSAEIQQQEMRRYDRCIPLMQGFDDVKSKYDQLYEDLHNAEYPLIMVQRREIPADDKRLILAVAILTDYPEDFMYEIPYMEASVFHRENSDIPDTYRQEAWAILYCEVNLKCDSNDYRKELRTNKYRAYEYEEISAVEASIRNAISQHDLEALGL